MTNAYTIIEETQAAVAAAESIVESFGRTQRAAVVAWDRRTAAQAELRAHALSAVPTALYPRIDWAIQVHGLHVEVQRASRVSLLVEEIVDGVHVHHPDCGHVETEEGLEAWLEATLIHCDTAGLPVHTRGSS